MPDPPVTVLDSYAVLALFGAEAGSDQVQAILRDAEEGRACVCMSQINLGEVLYIAERERGLPAAQRALATIEQLPIELMPATRERILQAAHIKATANLSYPDAFAAAAASELKGSVLTGDPEFAEVENMISVTWLPRE
ncbi:MAG: type II toxin-antitoxin system VapC family toxin [Candidatus Latescibacteria bacterium]|jgi:predicted nucleic acid-binding protein|nr:type II toxin-antitoxin system VapC family toxin [Candidatus Latescibacterota bacterium]